MVNTQNMKRWFVKKNHTRIPASYYFRLQTERIICNGSIINVGIIPFVNLLKLCVIYAENIYICEMNQSIG